MPARQFYNVIDMFFHLEVNDLSRRQLAGVGSNWMNSESMSKFDCYGHAAKLVGQLIKGFSDLPLGFAVAAQVVIQTEIGFASGTYYRLAVTDLAQKRASVKIAAGATDVDALAVEVHATSRSTVIGGGYESMPGIGKQI